MTTGMKRDQNVERQMGCMAGFLQFFDRHPGKRIYATKRLPPTAYQPTSHSEESIGSLASKELQQMQQQQQQQEAQLQSSPECTKSASPLPEIKTADGISEREPLPLTVFDFKEGLRSSWKFRESPRLSLDSRATVDVKGSLHPKAIRTTAAILSESRCESAEEATMSEENYKQRRSPSVVARLMGLEVLPESGLESLKTAELRRSASESRSRDLLQYRFTDGNNFQQKHTFKSSSGSKISSNAVEEGHSSEYRGPRPTAFCFRKPKSEQAKVPCGGLSTSPWKSQQQRKSFFDSQDFFPGPKQTGSLYGEIEKRLKMRGIDEPPKDLETLKQILEALQLKGLLHSKKASEQVDHRNFVFDRKLSPEESPIVIMKPSKSPVSINRSERTINTSPPSNLKSRPGIRRNLSPSGEGLAPMRLRRDRPEIDRNLQTERRTRNAMSPDRNDNNARSPSSLGRRKSLSIETQMRGNDSVEQRRISPIHSPKINSKFVGSPRNRRKSTADISMKERISCPTEDESSSISASSISTSSQIVTESQTPKMEDYKEGKSLLERCDQLLHIISEITTSESQPSPVSVLDSSFYKDESSISPVIKRCIDFKDQPIELEEENWSPVISPCQLKSDDYDFIYVSEIFKAYDYLLEDSDVFLLLEKQKYKKNSSNISMLHRRLIFDTITEILEKKRQLPPWKTVSVTNFINGKPSLRQIWLEFERIRAKKGPTENIVEVISEVLQKDMASKSINGWGDCPIETSEVVLYIERLIFKDLIGETIGDLAAFTGKGKTFMPRRKLVF